ncbi:hypothetical protein LOTGIDRAFT_152764 [Lottia gigantea]|uniref:Uncharacterized protein n=1 Tax=Lottia gigantea TaxID=225164 RepID=V4AV20_LOTGI|nr:hypothetical protein LOTGIDRAFT_152764 [Lottia gigantea]ESO97676.1 hypothetical protein LOTGIDRAFT_152764 [Lottia gigantea]
MAKKEVEKLRRELAELTFKIDDDRQQTIDEALKRFESQHKGTVEQYENEQHRLRNEVQDLSDQLSRQWLTKVQRALDNPLYDGQKGKVLSLLLEGYAKTNWEIMPDALKSDYDAIIQMLKQTFIGPLHKHTKGYAARLRILAREHYEFEPQVIETVVIDRFMNTIPEKVKRYIYEHSQHNDTILKSLEKIIHIAKTKSKLDEMESVSHAAAASTIARAEDTRQYTDRPPEPDFRRKSPDEQWYRNRARSRQNTSYDSDEQQSRNTYRRDRREDRYQRRRIRGDDNYNHRTEDRTSRRDDRQDRRRTDFRSSPQDNFQNRYQSEQRQFCEDFSRNRQQSPRLQRYSPRFNRRFPWTTRCSPFLYCRQFN